MRISENLLNAFKTAFACLLGCLIAYFFKFESQQWLIITIVVVMSAQVNVGGVLKKSYLRLLGTFAGAIIASMSLLFFKENPVMLSIVSILSIFTFTYLGNVFSNAADAAKLGSATIALTLLSTHPDLHVAALRLSEIFWGIVIALAVNMTIFPFSASKKLQKVLADNLIMLKNYYDASLRADRSQCQILEENMMKNFMLVKNLCQEAAAEISINIKINKHKHTKYYQTIFYHEKRLFRSISLLEHYLIKTPEHHENFKQLYRLMGEYLEKLYSSLIENKKSMRNTSSSHNIINKTQKIDLNKLSDQFLAHFMIKEIKSLIKIIH